MPFAYDGQYWNQQFVDLILQMIIIITMTNIQDIQFL